ncbi:MAG TPA: pectinesterase family protein [Pseudonocardiaceae bacterium]|nr:pectinesterase family protein [Pseudonocardiaceae bacterium]
MRPAPLPLACTVAACLTAAVLFAPSASASTTITVAKSGGDYTSVQAAINAVPTGGTPYVIRIEPGTYDETITVPTSKPNLTIQGTTGNAENVVIAAGHAAWMTKPGGGTYGTAGSATATIAARNVTLQNITIANTYNPAAYPQGYAQAVAINADGDRQVYSGDRFLGLQDTVLTWEPNQNDGYRQLFEGGFIEGDVDFLCGDSTAVFYRDNITLHDRGAAAGGLNGYLAAPATDSGIGHGYLIDSSTVSSSAAAGSFYLGRPWHPYSGADPQIVIRNTLLPNQIKTDPWTTMHGYAFTPGRYGEYDNTGPGATVNPDRPQLSASKAADYTPQTYLAGTDGWNPLGRT